MNLQIGDDRQYDSTKWTDEEWAICRENIRKDREDMIRRSKEMDKIWEEERRNRKLKEKIEKRVENNDKILYNILIILAIYSFLMIIFN